MRCSMKHMLAHVALPPVKGSVAPAIPTCHVCPAVAMLGREKAKAGFGKEKVGKTEWTAGVKSDMTTQRLEAY